MAGGGAAADRALPGPGAPVAQRLRRRRCQPRGRVLQFRERRPDHRAGRDGRRTSQPLRLGRGGGQGAVLPAAGGQRGDAPASDPDPAGSPGRGHGRGRHRGAAGLSGNLRLGAQRHCRLRSRRDARGHRTAEQRPRSDAIGPRALRRAALAAAITALTAAGCAAQSSGEAHGSGDGEEAPLPSCEWCGTAEAPDDLDWRTTIAGPEEPGQRIRIHGVVYQPDGRTPAEDVLLYLYHTDAEGVYATRGNETGNGRRHGHLRAWLRTDDGGRYEIRTIRPGNYPGTNEEQHIHVTVQEPDDTPEYWLPSFKFADDPYLDADPGAPHVLELRRGDDGVWMARRDIVLPEEPPR